MQNMFEVVVSEPNYFVGLEIKINRETSSIFIHISNYIKRMLERFDLAEASENSIPADPHATLTSTIREEENIGENIPYRQAVGSLMFAAITARPDITYAVNIVS
ncbi:hypothetical protein QE152_g33337 [Popillia japonica]|uniref:Uncharacterized protein n=1 Tax=Popillia japonica TaxID=7064 RepID=A0AAW1IX06_POPJA